MAGMKAAGMATTGKHFPGHGSIVPDSHVADAIDDRSFDEIFDHDAQTFVQTLDQLDALMPAHVIFSQVDDKPAGFSKVWLRQIIRDKLGFDGLLFSDDLSMKAAHVAGDVDARVVAAIEAGCDMALVCNDRQGALMAIEAVKPLPEQPQHRFDRMKGNIPAWQGSLYDTCLQFDGWQAARARVQATFFDTADIVDGIDPTNYTA